MVHCHYAGLDQDDDVEIPWWTYGARGMQLWFPKALSEPLSASSPIHYATDPELEFDREVYPIGVSLSEVSIVGVLRPIYSRLIAKNRKTFYYWTMQSCTSTQIMS